MEKMKKQSVILAVALFTFAIQIGSVGAQTMILNRCQDDATCVRKHWEPDSDTSGDTNEPDRPANRQENKLRHTKVHYPGSLTALEVANRFWDEHTTKCGDSVYFLIFSDRGGSEQLVQGKNPKITIRVRPRVPRADEGLNPVELYGDTTIRFTVTRERVYKDYQGRPAFATWSRWKKGGEREVNRHGIAGVWGLDIYKRRGGQWEVSNCLRSEAPTCGQFKAIPCADIDGPSTANPNQDR